MVILRSFLNSCCATFRDTEYSLLHSIQSFIILQYMVVGCQDCWVSQARKRTGLHLKCSYPGGVIVGDVLANQITLTRLAVLALKLQQNELMTNYWQHRALQGRTDPLHKTTQELKCQTITQPPAEERQYSVRSEDCAFTVNR